MIDGRSDLPSTALVSRSGLGAGEADGFRRSTVELLSSPFENESAIRENDFALTVLENLDHHWFFDNITGFSLCGPSSSRGFLLASAAPEDSMRNIEMVNHGNRTEDDEMKLRNAIKLPRPSLQRTFSELQERERRLELEEREKEKVKEKDREREVNPPRTEHQRSRSDIMGGWDSRTVGIHYRLPSYDLTQKRVRFLDSAINPVQEITGTMLSSVKAKQHSGIPRRPKLESLPSGKQLQEPASLADLAAQQSRVRRRDRRRATKSMTDLEIDELQGFMDLGFKFNMNNLSPHVVNMLPGLQRLGGQRIQTSIVNRPYLSEAWLVPRSDSPVLNWRVPSEHGEAVTMKEQLKFWARNVASTMQEES